MNKKHTPTNNNDHSLFYSYMLLYMCQTVLDSHAYTHVHWVCVCVCVHLSPLCACEIFPTAIWIWVLSEENILYDWHRLAGSDT